METLTRDVVELSDHQLFLVNNRLRELTKRAERLGVTPPSVEVVRTFNKKRVLDGPFGITVTSVYHDVVLHEAHIKYDGWKFVAMIDHRSGIVFTAPDAVEGTVAQYQTVDAVCEHCQRKSSRNKTVILEHDDGRRMQVGKSCLKNYLGGFPTLSDAAFTLLQPFREFDEDNLGGGFDWRTSAPKSFVAVCLAVMRVYGYQRANEVYGTATLAALLLSGPRSREQYDQLKDVAVTESDYERAGEIVDWVSGRNASTDFELNLRVACMASQIFNNTGLLAFAPELYRREVEKPVKVDRPTGFVVEGKVTVTGEVMSVKLVDNPFTYNGKTLKMVVWDDRGFRVFGTVPAALVDDGNFQEGCRVQFVADVEASDSQTFGFYKRPSKARVLLTTEGEGK